MRKSFNPLFKWLADRCIWMFAFCYSWEKQKLPCSWVQLGSPTLSASAWCYFFSAARQSDRYIFLSFSMYVSSRAEGSINQTYSSCFWNIGLCPNVSLTPITAMGCRQCLPLCVVQLKGKHCPNPHFHNGVVDTLCAKFYNNCNYHQFSEFF